MKRCTISDIENCGKEMLTAADIAPLLGFDPQSIRAQAQYDAEKLGFPVTVVGTRVSFPRIGFVNWFKNSKEGKA